MKDTIYREDAIKAVCKGCREEFKECAHHWSCPKLNELAAVPSMDRPQGRWIPASWQDENCPERLKRHKCSACGNRAEMVLVKTKLVDNYYCNKAEPITEYTHQEQLSDFCSHCGARMKGADDECN